MTQTKLAELLDVHANTVNNYMTGRTAPTVARLAAIATILGCRVIDLLPREGRTDAE